MDAAESVLNLVIDNAVVFSGAFPTHAANEADNALPLHIHLSSTTYCVCLELRPLRTLSLCTCCRHYLPAQRLCIWFRSVTQPCQPSSKGSSDRPSSFSRLAPRSLALHPAHSRCHQFVTCFPKASATSSPPWLLLSASSISLRGTGVRADL